MVKEIQDHDEFMALVNGDKLAVIDFHAQWCGPCKSIAPKYEELAGNAELSEVEFAKVDVDKVPKASEYAKIKAMPTFKLYKGGKELNELVGTNIKLLEKRINDNK